MAEEQGHMNEVISDADEKLGQIADMIRDSLAKFDSLTHRMDAMESKMGNKSMDAEMPSMENCDDDMEVMEPGEPREVAADRRTRKDAESFEEWAKEEAMEPEHKKDAEEEEEDCMDEEGDMRVADALQSTRDEMASLRRQIAHLNARAPAMLSDIDRERFAVIQESADPAFQAFGDRAPAPLSGETPTQYKRRLGSKLQSNSPKWANSRLSAVSDDAMLDTILADVYADSIAAARRGSDVMPGHLREISRQVGGHIINEFVGEPSSWMGGFVGQVKRAGAA
jgi:hypothetical protein